jgi:hypothetical protein
MAGVSHQRVCRRSTAAIPTIATVAVATATTAIQYSSQGSLSDGKVCGKRCHKAFVNRRLQMSARSEKFAQQHNHHSIASLASVRPSALRYQFSLNGQSCNNSFS